MKTEAPLRTPSQIYREGFAVLCDHLGMADAIRFIQQFDLGRGDYTRERDSLFEGETVGSLARQIRERRAVGNATHAGD